jgi:hypothetical protein
LGTEYKCVFSNLNWKKRQDGYKALWVNARLIFGRI